jgi:hypothetical protein
VSPHGRHKTRAKNRLEKGMDYGFFTEKKSRIKKALKQMFGPELSDKFEIKQAYLPVPTEAESANKKGSKKKTPKRKQGYFTVNFKEEDITIIYL